MIKRLRNRLVWLLFHAASLCRRADLALASLALRVDQREPALTLTPEIIARLVSKEYRRDRDEVFADLDRAGARMKKAWEDFPHHKRTCADSTTGPVVLAVKTVRGVAKSDG